MPLTKAALIKKLKQIAMLVNDVDGVLTDGGVYLFENGVEGKRFSVLDGAGCGLAQRGGLETAWVTARKSTLLEQRAKECKVTYVLQGRKQKLGALDLLLKKARLTAGQVAYIGDDLVDLPVMEKVGLAIAVPNAVAEVRQAAHYITAKAGGQGAVREVIEMILKTQGRWDQAVYFFQARHEEKN